MKDLEIKPISDRQAGTKTTVKTLQDVEDELHKEEVKTSVSCMETFIDEAVQLGQTSASVCLYYERLNDKDRLNKLRVAHEVAGMYIRNKFKTNVDENTSLQTFIVTVEW